MCYFLFCKISSKNAGNGISESLDFKISQGSMPPNSPTDFSRLQRFDLTTQFSNAGANWEIRKVYNINQRAHECATHRCQTRQQIKSLKYIQNNLAPVD